MEPFDLDEEELKSLLGAAGRVTPPADFARQVMARVANDPVPATAPAGLRWRRAPHRLVALVLPGTLLGSMFLLLAALLSPGGRTGSEVIPGQWLAHPVAEALSRPATLMGLLSLALAVWALACLARQTGPPRMVAPTV
jgi:hypothetical protein